jgi:hypothetical protein
VTVTNQLPYLCYSSKLVRNSGSGLFSPTNSNYEKLIVAKKYFSKNFKLLWPQKIFSSSLLFGENKLERLSVTNFVKFLKFVIKTRTVRGPTLEGFVMLSITRLPKKIFIGTNTLAYFPHCQQRSFINLTHVCNLRMFVIS